MNGVINVYKPQGITSFDVVSKIRKIAGEKKVGHTGTLDPLASGVLPVCLGKGTKFIDYLMSGEKVYNVVLKLGIATDTYDREGKILLQRDLNNINEDDIKKCIQSFIGEINQIPPMYSAIKINGKKLYELARQGLEVEREPRKINIYDINIKSIKLPYMDFTVRCSKGTYIRSLCYDIGEKLNCGGMMYSLERESNGVFSKETSIPLEDLNDSNINKALISIEEALKNYPKLIVREKFYKLLVNGVCVKDPSLTEEKILENILYRVYSSDNNFIGLGKKVDEGFKIIKLL